MAKMNDLRDLLTHEVMDLHSAEEQIIEAMPAMISKANDPALKQALQEHLRITEQQLSRLDQVRQALDNDTTGDTEDNSLFGRLFGSGGHKCRGMNGIIEEGQKVMAEDMDQQVLDAAIIGCAQKIEHYEISGYGTAKAYANELGLSNVAQLLEQTLNEEYEADDRLTSLAEGRINQEAQNSGGSSAGSYGSSTGTSGTMGTTSGSMSGGSGSTFGTGSTGSLGGSGLMGTGGNETL